MATQTIRVATFPGLTTPKMGLFNSQSGVEVVAEDTASVVGDASAGIYSRAFTDVAAGRYAVIVFDGTTEVARDYVTLTLTTATFYTEGMQAPSTGTDHSDQLDRIEAKANLITSGTPVQVVSSVASGGTITLILGDDYKAANSNTVDVQISDADESVKDYLQAASSVIFGAGRGKSANEITGTVTLENITHSAGITTIPVEIPSTATANATASSGPDYVWHLKAVDGSGNEVVKASGRMTMQHERATPTT